jgi:hypothetical protein
MMQKQFKDLEINEQFNHNGVAFVRVPDEKISCCKTLNAENISTKEKIMILPLEEVETN